MWRALSAAARLASTLGLVWFCARRRLRERGGAAFGWEQPAGVRTQPTPGAKSRGNKRAALQVRDVRLMLLRCLAVSEFVVDFGMGIEWSVPCALNTR